MESENKYFHITLELLKDKQIFPFHLYVFNPINREYSTFIFANSPLTKGKKAFLEYIIEKNGEIAVEMTQKKTFLNHQEFTEENVPSLKRMELHDLEKKRKQYLKLREKKQTENGVFILDEELQHAEKNGDFSKIIEEVHDEVLTFHVTKSNTISLAIHFCEKLLNKDNHINRIVSASYLLGKACNMNSEEVLSDIICSSYLHHIGFTQMDLTIVNSPTIELSDPDLKEYKKHSGLAHHLINKSKIKLEERCLNAILEHHERYDGSGYPLNKKGKYIEPVALLIGAVSHIFDYSSGRISGNITLTSSVINNIKNKTFTAGLEFEFGDTIYDNLIYLMTSNKFKKAA